MEAFQIESVKGSLKPGGRALAWTHTMSTLFQPVLLGIRSLQLLQASNANPVGALRKLSKI
jgi:hypothetical protein